MKLKREIAQKFINIFLTSIVGDKGVAGFGDKGAGKYGMAAGSFRRGLSVVNDIDILVFKSLPAIVGRIASPTIAAKLARHGVKIITPPIVCGPIHCAYKVIIDDRGEKLSFKLDLFYVPPGEKIPSILHWTGSKNLNIRMRAQAKRLGYKLNQHGLFKVDKAGKLPDKLVAIKTEKDIFKLLRVTYLPPEKRSQ